MSEQSHKKLMEEVESGKPLRHVAVDHDASQPRIEGEVHLRPSPHKELLQEVQAQGAHRAALGELKQTLAEGVPLHHVTDANDRSAPAIPSDARVGHWDKGAFLAEIQAPHELHHVPPSEVHDKSTPVVDGSAEVNVARAGSAHDALMGELKAVGSHPKSEVLHHVAASEIADRSSPKVEKTAAMRVAGKHEHQA